jgi:hypothetical protein
MNINDDGKPFDLVVLQCSDSPKTNESYYLRALGGEKVAWAARNAGYKTICISRLALLNTDQLVELIEPFISSRTVIGISTTLMTSRFQYWNVDKSKSHFVEAIELLRKKHNNKILLGGPIASDFKFEFPDSDILESEDGENVIIDYLNKHLNNGLSKKIVPHWHINQDCFQFHETSFIQKEDFLPLEVGKGCIFSCKFCGYTSVGKPKGSYEKDMQLIKNYIINNYEKYGVQHYSITADTLNDNNDRMNEWCDMIESLPFNIYYSCFLRLDLVHKYQNTAKRLYQTGLRGANFGVETFHPVAGKLIEKTFNGQRAKDFLIKVYDDIFEKNANVSIGIIIGLPHEPIESMYETADWLSNEGKMFNASFNPLTIVDPNRGSGSKLMYSKFMRDAEKYGFKWPSKDIFYWKNGAMSYYKAVKIASELQAKFHYEVGPWNHVQRLACNSDFSFTKNYFQNVRDLGKLHLNNRLGSR